MNDWLSNLSISFRYQDLIDILIVAVLVYRLLLLIRGTRAVQMIAGLGVLTLGFFLSSQFEFYTTHWVLSNFFDYAVFIVIIIFQDDLRRALARIGKTPFFLSRFSEYQSEMVDEIARAATQMAKEKCGALIVIERDTGLKNFMDTGSKIDARVRAEILFSIFLPESPLHDGAVIISGDLISSAGCFLPLSKDSDLDKSLGTRHRAAVGLTEETDAVVVLVSEEAGQAHLVHGGEILKNLTEEELRSALSEMLNLTNYEKKSSGRVKRFLNSQPDREGQS